jgi:3-oxoacyl-[acyl-carrier protein] reductase
VTRCVLVTGGNRGIGLGIARRFADAGDKVAVTYRSGEPPAGFFGVRCDVTDAGSVRAAVDAVRRQHGPVEVLVSNAGVTKDQLFARMPEADFASVMETNLMGGVRMTQAVLPDMTIARWGRLIYVSSITALAGAPGQANYAASKAGLIGFARSVAREMGKRNITANVVTPGLIDTDMAAGVTGSRREWLIGQTAVGRTGTVDEVAAAVAFLASEDAGYVTAATIPVTGGAGTGV